MSSHGPPQDQDFLQEHDLHAVWVLWEHSKVKSQKEYNHTSSLVQLHSFGTVEDFWRVWSYLPRISEVSKLKGLDAFSVFKKGITPTWEDPKNEKGCQFSWVLDVDNKNDTLIDNVWEDLVIACLGQVLEEGNDDICGIRAVDRTSGDAKLGKKKFYRLELWMGSETTDEIKDGIQERLMEAISGTVSVLPQLEFKRR